MLSDSDISSIYKLIASIPMIEEFYTELRDAHRENMTEHVLNGNETGSIKEATMAEFYDNAIDDINNINKS